MSGDGHTTYGAWARFAMPRHFKDLDGFTKHNLKPGLTPQQLAEALEHEHPRVRNAVLEHPDTPQEVVKRLIDAGSTPDLVGLSGAANPLSAGDWRKLRSGGPWARLLAVLHPSWNADASWHEVDVVVKKLLAVQLKTPEHFLKLLLCDESNDVRFLASRHPSVSDLRHQYELAGTSPSLRINDRPQAGVAQAFLLGLTNGNRWQRQLAARHFLTPPSLLEALSEDVSHMVRRAVSYNPATPANTLDRLAEDVWGPVRLGVARNPHSRADTLESLSRDRDDDVRLAVAQNTFTPESVLTGFLDSGALAFQIAAASNPRTPYASRLGVSQDPTVDPRVREVAGESLSRPVPEDSVNHRLAPVGIAVPEREMEVVEAAEKKLESSAAPLPLEKFAAALRGTTLKVVELGDLRTKEVVQTNVREHIDRIAMAAVMELEHRLGHQPLEMPHDNAGYDVLAQDGCGRPLYIEVKGKGLETEVVQVSRSQINFSQAQKERFVLAIVVTDIAEALSVHYVQQPFRDLGILFPKGVLSVTFALEHLLLMGEEVWVKPS